eukprot:TRINITY_DN16491_c0_g1_i1.p1 TRINITY_DN16491_c0_g1~~TRINITY_DN16491_c0_g1_i1.p1  ORF type:complete len:449 (+),score=49.48 TRINITY_DN16491_c0_g1_i1:66-1412(+)
MGLRRPVPKAVSIVNWKKDWRPRPKSSQSPQQIKKGQLFQPPSGMLWWDDRKCATFIVNNASSAREVIHTRESYSASKLLIGKMMAIPSILKSRGCKINVLTYNEIMRVLSWAGQHKTCLELLSDMRSNNVAPDSDSYSHVISAVSRNDNYSILKEALQLMNDDGIKPTPAIWLSILRFYAFSGNKKGVASTVQAMAASNIPLCPLSWSLLILSKKDYNEGKLIFEEMLSLGHQPTEVHFESLFSCAAASRSISEAEQLFAAILNAGRDVSKPSWYDLFEIPNKTNYYKTPIYANRVVTFGMLKVYCRSGSLTLATRFLDSMKSRNIRLNNKAYSYYAECYRVALEEKRISNEEADAGALTILHAAVAASILSSRRLYYQCLRIVSITLNTEIALKIRKLAEAHGVREHTLFKQTFDDIFIRTGNVPPPPAFYSPSVMFPSQDESFRA